MKKKDELKADFGLKQLGVRPQIYHFETRVKPFTAVTIAVETSTWTNIRRDLDHIFFFYLSVLTYEKATRMKKELRKRGIYGVAICDSRDNLNRQRGRTIAKGRLWKHLKQQKGK